MLKRIIFKLIFFDKFILRIFRKFDIGIIKINDLYIADIPKSGSSTLKNIAALRSKRYRILKKFFNCSPMHSCISPICKIEEIHTEQKLYVFIKSPDERLYSVFKEKVQGNKMSSKYSLIKKDKILIRSRFNYSTKFNKKNSFLDFCNGIIELKRLFIKKDYGVNYFDKHIVSQYNHILNLQKSYPNIKNFKIIVYQIDNLNKFLSGLLGKENNSKFNSTRKGSDNYMNIIKKTNIINLMYSKDEILFKKLISSKKDFIEFSFDSFIDIGN